MQPVIDVIEGFRVVKHPTYPGYCVLNPQQSYPPDPDGPHIITPTALHGHWVMKDHRTNKHQVFKSLESIAERIADYKASFSGYVMYSQSDYGVANSPLRRHIRCNQS